MAGYYNQFEPAWPGKSVMRHSDRLDAATIYRSSQSSLTKSTIAMQVFEARAVKLTDEAIAHAIRESYRN